MLLCDGEDTHSTSTGVHIIHLLPVFQSASSVSDGLWNVLPDKIWNKQKDEAQGELDSTADYSEIASILVNSIFLFH